MELVTTTSSQNGAVCTRAEGDSGDITENIWYTGSRGSGEIQAETAGREVQTLKAPGISLQSDTERLLTPSNAGRIFTSSNAWKLFSMLWADEGEPEDEDWEEQGEETSSRIWRMPVRTGSVIWRQGIRGSFPTAMERRAAGIHGSLRITGPRERSISTSGI